MPSDEMLGIATLTTDDEGASTGEDEAPEDTPLTLLDRALRAVQQDGLVLARASAEARGDDLVVRAACRQNVAALAHASRTLRADKSFMLDVCSRNGRALEFASESLRGDAEVVLAAMDRGAGGFGDALQWASRALRDDEALCFAAMSRHGAASHWASRRLRGDRTFRLRLALAAKRGRALPVGGERLGKPAAALRDDRAWARDGGFGHGD
jgi:hypothetical protein